MLLLWIQYLFLGRSTLWKKLSLCYTDGDWASPVHLWIKDKHGRCSDRQEKQSSLCFTEFSSSFIPHAGTCSCTQAFKNTWHLFSNNTLLTIRLQLSSVNKTPVKVLQWCIVYYTHITPKSVKALLYLQMTLWLSVSCRTMWWAVDQLSEMQHKLHFTVAEKALVRSESLLWFLVCQSQTTRSEGLWSNCQSTVGTSQNHLDFVFQTGATQAAKFSRSNILPPLHAVFHLLASKITRSNTPARPNQIDI